ncbi:MAG: pentapeptide repeat-containing protein [Cyanobacteria bacterium P01_F01_bin.143]
MANPEHIERLLNNVKTWNNWRIKNSFITPELSHDVFAHEYLSGAQLDGANLSYSNLTGTILSRADLSSTNLRNANLTYANLSSTNLTGADLTYADLSGANLSGANLRNANLTGVNLSRVQALAKSFKGTILTGACITDWIINSQTNLQNVKCDYIYLNKGSYSSLNRRWIFKERIPHDPDKIFAPGEFTQLFQKVLETVNLIFSEGIEWVAFLESFQQLQAEIKSEELSIQAIEKKSNGAFVIRVEVPESANKAKIQKYLEREYEAKLLVIEAGYQKQLQAKDEIIQIKNEELVQAYREKSTDLLEVIKTMAGIKQTTNINNNPNMPTGNTYNQSGNIGIGHNQGNISGNTKIAGVINESAQQDLTAAATEIQQLLDQLSKTYPTKKYAEKMEVGAKLIEEIENNPTRWQKVINVIKAMGIEALAEAVDNPIFNIAKAGIEAAVESES